MKFNIENNVYLDDGEIDYLLVMIEGILDNISCEEGDCHCSEKGFFSHIWVKLDKAKNKK